MRYDECMCPVPGTEGHKGVTSEQLSAEVVATARGIEPMNVHVDPTIGVALEKADAPQPEDSGGSVDYYKAVIHNPTTATEPYVAECNDIIEALNLTYAEANIVKEIWRSAAEREFGKAKAGNSKKRAAEKVVFFAERYKVQMTQ